MIISRMSSDVSGGATPLPHWGVIRAEGADAVTFLNGQLTSDVAAIDGNGARLAGYCTAKGRLLASFVVWRPADDVVLLACSADLLAQTLKRLSMFVLRARCKLSDASASMPLFGIAGAAANPLLDELSPWSRRADTANDATVICLPDAGGIPRGLWCGSAAGAAPALPPMPIDAWERLEVESGVARVIAATVEQFVPQMLNYEAIGGIDFRKGCYPGQEVVARSQYRGTIKRRTLRFDSDAPAAPGDEVFAGDEPTQPAGMVVNAAPANGGSALLVEVKLAAAERSLHLRTVDGPALRRAALPYALPTNET
jgi:folate-binding protein YgfZ